MFGHCVTLAQHYNDIGFILSNQHYTVVYISITFNPFRPEFTIVIFIHYKPRIAVAILDL